MHRLETRLETFVAIEGSRSFASSSILLVFCLLHPHFCSHVPVPTPAAEQVNVETSHPFFDSTRTVANALFKLFQHGKGHSRSCPVKHVWQLQCWRCPTAARPPKIAEAGQPPELHHYCGNYVINNAHTVADAPLFAEGLRLTKQRRGVPFARQHTCRKSER